ncbi:hypothetical protein NDU88_000861 [Pleurodeles waltl]|uniref:Uncharacterized protein n=1 Tax=Pleurodeles waltl TaxID=8319 RepID=A0AAV7M1F0_PLEWA|nr:hypothetical protein NDU88_000861 [Pleurodeles waltl]
MPDTPNRGEPRDLDVVSVVSEFVADEFRSLEEKEWFEKDQEDSVLQQKFFEPIGADVCGNGDSDAVDEERSIVVTDGVVCNRDWENSGSNGRSCMNDEIEDDSIASRVKSDVRNRQRSSRLVDYV